MRLFQRTVASSAIALALAASGNAAAQYSNVYFFGDSLIDSGNYKSNLPPGTGLFTTNPGPVLSQVIAQRFGFTATPSTQTGGNNYAYGGARVTLLPGVVGSPLSPSAAVPVATQVQQYLAKGPADPNALYSVSGGGNDFFYQFGLLAAGAATPAQVQAALGTAAVQLATQAALLKAAGARNTMIWYVPDVGTSLDGAATGQGPTLTALSNFFNSTLGGTLDTLGVQAIRLNSVLIQNEILKNPAAFGLTNVTGIACTLPPADTIALCKSSTLVSPRRAEHVLLRERLPSDDGRAPDLWRLRDFVHRRSAADGGTRRSPARGRAGELPRARRPDVVEPQRPAQSGKARGLGRLRLLSQRPAGGGQQRQQPHEYAGSGRRRESLRPDAGRPDGHVRAEQGRLRRGRWRLHDEGTDRHDVRRLRRRAVVRRRDRGRGQSRLFGHQPRHSAWHGAAHRERRGPGHRVHRPAARRLLVPDAGPAARPVRAPDVDQGLRPRVLGDVHGQHGALLRRAEPLPAAVERRLAGGGQCGQHSSVCESDVGVRLAGSGTQRRRILGHAGRQLQRSGGEARQQLCIVQRRGEHRIRRGHRVPHGLGNRRSRRWQLLGRDGRAHGCRSSARRGAASRYAVSDPGQRCRGLRGARANSAS